MTSDYDVSMDNIETPAPPPRYFRLQLRIDLRAVEGTGRVVADGSRLVSLSASGIGFVPTSALAKGASLNLEFDVRGPNVSVGVTTVAEVVRVIDDDFELYVGCRFVDFDERAQQALLGVLQDVREKQEEDNAA
jgi:hypothetical protein